MATFTKTISNRIQTNGPSPTSKFGVMVWGDNWGDSKDSKFTVGKYVGNSLALTGSVFKSSRKYISNSVAFSSRINFVGLLDGSGYYYVFPNNTTDPDDRYFPTWTAHSDPGSSWTSGVAGVSTWSAA